MSVAVTIPATVMQAEDGDPPEVRIVTAVPPEWPALPVLHAASEAQAAAQIVEYRRWSDEPLRFEYATDRRIALPRATPEADRTHGVHDQARSMVGFALDLQATQR